MKTKKAKRLAISIMSFAAMSAINYTIIHNPIVLLASLILFMHDNYLSKLFAVLTRVDED